MAERDPLTKEFIKILDDCGFMDNIVRSMDVNDKIRELENKARAARPLGAPIRAPLTGYLSTADAEELVRLRQRREDIKTESRIQENCILDTMKSKGIVAIKGPKREISLGRVYRVESVEYVAEEPCISEEEADELTVTMRERQRQLDDEMDKLDAELTIKERFIHDPRTPSEAVESIITAIADEREKKDRAEEMYEVLEEQIDNINERICE